MKYERKTTSCITRRRLLKYGIKGALAVSLGGGTLLTSCRRKPVRIHGGPNVILITLDTTRADRLGCYGYKRNTSPNLDLLAEESVFYTKAIAPSSWTLPSHASLFTGKFTASHGARYDPEGPLRLLDAIQGPERWATYRVRGLSPGELTLAALLKQKGYQTGTVVGGPWMKKVFGLANGFEFYDDTGISTSNGRSAPSITAAALEWARQVKGKKFFLFLNYFDPHAPYAPPKEFQKVFLPNYAGGTSSEEMNALYDAEILCMDYYIGKLLKKLKSWGLYENTWIIAAADHGELLGEHGQHGHGRYLYQEELHVPLFMKYPGGEFSGKKIDAYVQLIDIFAMVCDRLDVAAPDDIQGSSKGEAGHPIIAETYPLALVSADGHWRALYDENIKFIWNSLQHHELFNLKEDPREQTNLANLQAVDVARMSKELENYLSGLPKPLPAGKPVELDEKTKEALKSLGYVK